jgi:autotransporter-associated beta strand protein
MNLVKSGGGIQVLSGTNTYTGSTTISGGRLRLGAAGALGNGTTNTTGVAVNGTAIFDLAGITPTATVPLTLNSTANGFDVGSFTNSSGGTATYTGDVDLQAASVRTGALSPNHMTLTGGITGNGKNFTKDGSNIMTLSNSGTVTLGTLQIFRGNLQIDSGTSLNPSGNFTLGGGNSVAAILTMNGGSLTVPSAQTATFGAGAGSATSSLNLNSGTLTVPGFVKGSQNYSVNFNGGTLMANADNASFMTAIGGSARVLAGGAFIDDGGFDILIDQPLIDDTVPTGGGLTKSGIGTLTLAGTNTYTGDTTVAAGALELAPSGTLTFVPTAPGTTNMVTGTGSADFNGSFNIDLTNADPTDGNSWVLADVSTQTFDSATFTVSGFSEAPEGTWTFVDGSNTWTFTESDATLRLAVASSGFASWIATFPGVGSEDQPGDDPDQDGIDNLLEYVLNGNPTLSDHSILPTLNVTATDYEFTYQRRDDSVSPETTQTFEWGTTLAAWPGSAVIPATSGAVGVATITVSPGIPNDSVTDTVKISIPITEDGGTGKLFGRLKVVKP